MRPVIVHIATERGIRSFRNIKRRGQSIGFDAIPVRYSELPNHTEWPRGIYLFSDMERATKWQCSLAALLWQRLAEEPDGFRLYNHPVNHLRRYELLRALHEAGINDFNAYRVGELPDGMRFPVFVRYTDQHIGPSTDLLHDRRQLDESLARMLVEGHPPERLIVVEFLDTSGGTGRFLKYGAFRLGEQVYAGHVLASDEWTVKREFNERSLNHGTDLAFVKHNPYEDQIMRAFQIAGLTWGRIDFGVVDGRIQVWEINDNPKLGSSLFKGTKGRKPARVFSRRNRRAAFAKEMRGVTPGPPLTFQITPSLIARTLFANGHALASETTEA